MAVTLAAICTGISTTLGAAAGIVSSTAYDELTEGISIFDCPRLEVHPSDGTCDPSGATDRTTFQAGMQQMVITIYADLYAAKRSQLHDDMKATVTLADALMTVLQTQERPPFFGVEGIKACSWRWRRMSFKRSKAWYMGVRFEIRCKIF